MGSQSEPVIIYIVTHAQRGDIICCFNKLVQTFTIQNQSQVENVYNESQKKYVFNILEYFSLECQGFIASIHYLAACIIHTLAVVFFPRNSFD